MALQYGLNADSYFDNMILNFHDFKCASVTVGFKEKQPCGISLKWSIMIIKFSSTCKLP